MSPRERIRLASELEEAVKEAFVEQLARYDRAPPSATIRDKSNKWLVTSAWQKAIRRGQVQIAQLMAAGLFRLDPEYPWRRLPVIALEDVGAANPLLIAQVVWVAGKPTWRRKNGGDLKFLMLLTERLARSPKDRVACDLEVWTDIDPGLQTLRQTLAGRSRGQLLEAAADPEVALAQRHLALRYLAGTKVFPGTNLVLDRPGTFTSVIDAGQAMGLHDDALTIVLWARHKAGSMALSLMLAFEMRGEAEDEVTLEPDPIVDLPMIGPYPSYALDLHCHQGKRAIAYFAKACQPMRAWLEAKGVPEDRYTATISELLFRAETEMLDQRMVYGDSRRIQMMSWYATVCGYSPLAAEFVEEGVLMMREHLPDLHQARVRVMGG